MTFLMRHWPGVVLLALCLPAGSASAACSFNPGFSLQNVMLAFPATLSVPRDAAVGTVLATAQTATATGSTAFASCGSPGNAYRYFSSGAPVATLAGYPTFATSVPGVGLQAWLQAGSTTYPFVANGSGSNDSLVGPWAWSSGGTSNWMARLVVTGPVSGGQDSGSLSASVTLDALPVASLHFSSFSVSTLACITPNVSVSMGTHPVTDFQGINQPMRPSPMPFSLVVAACPAGLNTVSYQIQPLNSVLNAATGVVALDGSSTASGVGIAITNSQGTAINYNTPYALTAYNSSVGGTYTIPLAATYYQTAATITPGSANATFEFTMTYQ